ncbi:hypothetical protein PAMP_009111 [Pampus punctatissimus]
MSSSPQTHITVDEEIPLNTVAGSGEVKNITCNEVISITGQKVASCCNDKYHRKLAICSIICGISCIGIKALINSVKAEREPNQATAEKLSQKAKKFGIISIMMWISILVLTPMLMALISYLLTLID